MRYFLHLAYDGTRFHGWQVQPNTVTVQAEVDRCLSQVLRQPTCCLGSGRTDTGVHASHQVAHFEAELPNGLPLDVLLYRLRRALPPDVAALRLHPVPANAHARFSAEERKCWSCCWRALRTMPCRSGRCGRRAGPIRLATSTPSW